MAESSTRWNPWGGEKFWRGTQVRMSELRSDAQGGALCHLGFGGFIGFLNKGRNDGNRGLLGLKLIFRLAQHEEVVEGALVHDMEARLITTEVGELRPGGQFGEGSGDAGEFGAFGLGGGGRFEEVILDGPVAAEEVG